MSSAEEVRHSPARSRADAVEAPPPMTDAQRAGLRAYAAWRTFELNQLTWLGRTAEEIDEAAAELQSMLRQAERERARFRIGLLSRHFALVPNRAGRKAVDELVEQIPEREGLSERLRTMEQDVEVARRARDATLELKRRFDARARKYEAETSTAARVAERFRERFREISDRPQSGGTP